MRIMVRVGKYALFQKYYKEHMSRVYRYVFFRTGRNKELTEDLVSEIFLKALENFDSFDNSKSFTAWIFRIAKNHMIDMFRKSKKTTSLEEIINIIPSKLDTKEIANLTVDIEHLQEAMETLPEEKKELIGLRYFSDYSFKEIGRITGRDEVTVRVAVHRTLKELKEKLQHIK